MQTLAINYDKKFDILYARYPGSGHSYGEEDPDGIITYRNIEDDSITGIAIYEARDRITHGKIELKSLPVSLEPVRGKLNSIFAG